MDDRELIRKCVAGDAAAWRAFVARFDPLIRRHAQQIYRSGDVDDVTAAVYEYLVVKQYRILKSFRWQCSLEKWIRIVTRTCAIRAMRKSKPREELGEMAGGENPQDLAERQEELERGRMVFESLPERDRLVLTMFLYDGLDYREIGARLNMPMGSVGSIISRARQKLSAALQNVKRIE